MKVIKFMGYDSYCITKNVGGVLAGNDFYYPYRYYNKYHGWLGMPQWYIANDNKLEDL